MQNIKMERYTFCHYTYKDKDYRHYIDTPLKLSEEQEKELATILLSFPHFCIKDWLQRFLSFDCSGFDKDLLSLAANAFDNLGHSMLGIACEYAESFPAIKKLIDLGANPNMPDRREEKLPLHWAIANPTTFFKKDSLEATESVRYLLKRGARTDIISYDNLTILQYAISRKYTAAARLIQDHNKRNAAFKYGAIRGLLQGLFPPQTIWNISEFCSDSDISNLGLTCKRALKDGREEMEKVMKFK